jgi:hypothetical protein
MQFHSLRETVSLSSPGSPLRYEYNSTAKLYLVFVGIYRFAGITDSMDNGWHFVYLTNDPKNSEIRRRWFCKDMEEARQTLEKSFEDQRHDPVWNN